jgi:predicted amidophosphoribosyltransferase
MSQTIMYALKSDSIHADGLPISRYAARRIRETISQTPLATILTPTAVLVPAPKSGVHKAGGLWPAERIARALVAEGFGREVRACVRRKTAVRKAAWSPGNRPTVREHIESMEIVPDLVLASSDVVVVDDIVTEGVMMMACATLLRRSFSNIQVKGFAVMRTVDSDEGLVAVQDAVVGKIRCFGNICSRTP